MAEYTPGDFKCQSQKTYFFYFCANRRIVKQITNQFLAI